MSGRSVFCDSAPPPGLGQFLSALSVLAYRTLLSRVSQLHGVEKTAVKVLARQVDANNRFGIESCLGRLDEISRLLTQICRRKSGFDRRILGEPSALSLVHHVVEFQPIARYTLCEYFPFKYGNRRKSIWVSVNVLPIAGRTWLIVSHPWTRIGDVRAISREIGSWATEEPRLRMRQDLDAFVGFTNLYVSPDDFRALPEWARSSVACKMALKVCEEPFDKVLEYLRSSPAGQDLVSRCERRLSRRL